MSQWFDHEKLAALQLQKLRNILTVAQKNVPFYRDQWHAANINPNDLNTLQDLASFPFLNKNHLNSLPVANFLSSQNPKYFSIRKTTGTTGKPVVIFADRLTSACSLAARYRSVGWHGIEPGDKEARFWGAAYSTKDKIHQSVKDFLLNRIRIPSSIAGVADACTKLKLIEKFRTDYFYGYPSMIYKFTRMVEEISKPKLNIKSIISTAEKLHSFQKQKIESFWGAKVIDEYGCSETDIIAFECEHGRKHILSENILVEIIDNENYQEGKGEIVITDLNNTLMPLIRYRIGDLGQFDPSPCPCGRNLPVLKSVDGRTSLVQFIRLPNGELKHSVIFAYLFENYGSDGLPIAQFKVIQESIEHICVLIVPPQGHASNLFSELSNSLKRDFNNFFGNEMSLSINFVDEIPQNHQGKIGYFETKLTI